MALSLKSLTDIATDTGDLLEEIRKLQRSGTNEKTARLESDALGAIERVRQTLEDAVQAGSAERGDLKGTLEAELAVIEQRIATDPTLNTSELAKLLHEKATIKGRLAAETFTGGISWDSLIDDEDLDRFRRTIGAAAEEVRRRRKLASILDSVFSAFRIGLGISAKLATL
jgi:hypothetical protein